MQQSLDDYEKLKAEKEEKIRNATELAGDQNDVNSVGVFEKKIQTDNPVRKSKEVQTSSVVYQNLFKENSSNSSRQSKFSFSKSVKNLPVYDPNDNKSIISQSISTNLLEAQSKMKNKDDYILNSGKWCLNFY